MSAPPDHAWTPLDLGVRFDGRPHRLQVGVRRFDLDAWLILDEHRDAELRLKQQLLSDHHDVVCAALPSSTDAAQELLTLVVEAMAATGLVEVDDEGSIAHDRGTGIVTDLRAWHPIDAAGRLVQEDLCVMECGDDQWRLTAGSVCFPSRWSLAEKLGRTVGEIHQPVPGYERIAHATDLAMDRVLSSGPMTRANWTLIDDPTLFQPTSKAVRATDQARDHSVTSGMSRVGATTTDLQLRIERQTLRPLPRTGAIAFTIRTVVMPLARLSAPESLALARTLRTVERSTIAYKSWEGRLPELIAHLEKSAARES